MNILITGANGQLGSEIRELTSQYKSHNLLFRDRSELDITDINDIEDTVRSYSIDSIINCAAYTAVDLAEEQEDLADRVNRVGVEYLVKISEQFKIKLIHISTDYLFDGKHYMPYRETDSVAPIGVYGKSKHMGEQAILNSTSDSIIIRTSWLYSIFGNNFVKTMIRLGEERDELGVVFDQIGTPTYAADLAKCCLDILSNSDLNLDRDLHSGSEAISAKGRVYHYSNEGVTSWFDFAKAIHSIAGVSCIVKPIESKDFKTKAERPHYSVLNKANIKSDFSITIPYWRDSLEICINRLR